MTVRYADVGMRDNRVSLVQNDNCRISFTLRFDPLICVKLFGVSV
jgi:hypothetical protein